MESTAARERQKPKISIADQRAMRLAEQVPLLSKVMVLMMPKRWPKGDSFLKLTTLNLELYHINNMITLNLDPGQVLF